MDGLVGYSSGCFVTLEACRRVRRPETLGKVLLLSGAVSPGYAWGELADRLDDVTSFHSWLDGISGLGPLLFGGNDRRWRPGCGTVGFADPPPMVRQRRWRPADVWLGYFGDHFTIAAPRFVAAQMAPILGGSS